MPEADRLRVFFALWPPAAVAGELHRLARHIHAGSGGRVMTRDTLHLTLAFIGDVATGRIADLLALAANLGGGPGASLCLDRLGYWRHNHIVWAGASQPPPELAKLASQLGEALAKAGFPMERRPFHPHLTLLRKVANPPELPVAAVPPWPVTEFLLMSSDLRSDGARYRPLGRWPLGGQEA